MTTRRHDPSDSLRPHDEFWGEQTEWTPQRLPSAAPTGLGATLGRWWDALLGGGSDAGRAHGRPAAPSSPSSSPSDDTDELDDQEPIAHRRAWRSSVPAHRDLDRQNHDGGDPPDDLGDGAWELEPEPQPTRHPGVDPLLARLGGFAVIVTLAAPLVLGFTASGSDAQSADAMLSPFSTTPTSEVVDPTTPVVGAPPESGAPPDSATPTTAAAPAPDTAAPASPETTAPDVGDTEPDVSVLAPPTAAPLQDVPDPEPAETAPAVTTPPCGGRYEIAVGDYWIRLADAAGVSLADLLAVNDSSVDTVLVPGRSICLPVGAATPSPPATAAPAPAPTAPPATTAPSPPVTTAAPAPTTTVLSRPAAVPESQAAAIIRNVWPDDLEERALAIAWRESNHRSNVNNYCCYGLFQIHFTAHRSWLATIGVTSASQLFDPVVNATAAYTLYQRSGGFGPWDG